MMPLIVFLWACGSDPADPAEASPPVTAPDGTPVEQLPPALAPIAAADVDVFVDSVVLRCQGSTAAVILETLGQADAAELDLLGGTEVVTVPLASTTDDDAAIWRRFDGAVDCEAATATTFVARAFRDGVEVDCAVHGLHTADVLAGGYDHALLAAGRPDARACHPIEGR